MKEIAVGGRRWLEGEGVAVGGRRWLEGEGDGWRGK